MILTLKITKILALFLVLGTYYPSQGLINLSDNPNDGGYGDYLRDPPPSATDQPAMEYFQPQDYVENHDKATDGDAAAVAGDCYKEQNLVVNESETLVKAEDEGDEDSNGKSDSVDRIEGDEEEGDEQALNLEKRRVPINAVPTIKQITFDAKNFNEKVLREALGNEGVDGNVQGIPHCSPEEAERERAEFVKTQNMDGGDQSYLQKDDYNEIYDGESDVGPTESGNLLKKLLDRLRRAAQESNKQVQSQPSDGSPVGSPRAAGDLCVPSQQIPQQQCHCNVPIPPKPIPTCSTTCPTPTTCRTTTQCSSICPSRGARKREHTTIVHQLNPMAKSFERGMRKRHVDETLQPLLRQIVKESAGKADENVAKSEAETDENIRTEQLKNKDGQWYFSGKDAKLLERYLSNVMQSNSNGSPTGSLNDNSILMSILKELADNQSAKQESSQNI